MCQHVGTTSSRTLLLGLTVRGAKGTGNTRPDPPHSLPSFPTDGMGNARDRKITLSRTLTVVLLPASPVPLDPAGDLSHESPPDPVTG